MLKHTQRLNVWSTYLHLSSINRTTCRIHVVVHISFIYFSSHNPLFLLQGTWKPCAINIEGIANKMQLGEARGWESLHENMDQHSNLSSAISNPWVVLQGANFWRYFLRKKYWAEKIQLAFFFFAVIFVCWKTSYRPRQVLTVKPTPRPRWGV